MRHSRRIYRGGVSAFPLAGEVELLRLLPLHPGRGLFRLQILRAFARSKAAQVRENREFLRHRQISLVKASAARQAGVHDTYCLL